MKSINSTQRKALSVLAVIITVGAIALCLPLGKGNRKDFVGRVYPGTGYRCRFALSSAWKREHNTKETLGWMWIVEDSFVAPSENPIWHWITLHLFPQKVSAGNARSISLDIIQTKGDPFRYYIVDEYPHPFYSHHLRPSPARRLIIDGYPATVTTVIVYVPDHSVSYVVNGGTDTQNAAPVNREMQAIISSFHVEKVTPAGGER
jgi:hypothetical protein